MAAAEAPDADHKRTHTKRPHCVGKDDALTPNVSILCAALRSIDTTTFIMFGRAPSLLTMFSASPLCSTIVQRHEPHAVTRMEKWCMHEVPRARGVPRLMYVGPFADPRLHADPELPVLLRGSWQLLNHRHGRCFEACHV